MSDLSVIYLSLIESTYIHSEVFISMYTDKQINFANKQTKKLDKNHKVLM